MWVCSNATAVRIVRSSGLSVDTTIGSTEMYFNAKGELFRISPKMHWSTSTGGWVGSSRNGLYFKREGFHSHPQDRFFWIYSQSDEGKNASCWRGNHWEPVCFDPGGEYPLRAHRERAIYGCSLAPARQVFLRTLSLAWLEYMPVQIPFPRELLTTDTLIPSYLVLISLVL